MINPTLSIIWWAYFVDISSFIRISFSWIFVNISILSLPICTWWNWNSYFNLRCKCQIILNLFLLWIVSTISMSPIWSTYDRNLCLISKNAVATLDPLFLLFISSFQRISQCLAKNSYNYLISCPIPCTSTNKSRLIHCLNYIS